MDGQGRELVVLACRLAPLARGQCRSAAVVEVLVLALALVEVETSVVVVHLYLRPAVLARSYGLLVHSCCWWLWTVVAVLSYLVVAFVLGVSEPVWVAVLGCCWRPWRK